MLIYIIGPSPNLSADFPDAIPPRTYPVPVTRNPKNI